MSSLPENPEKYVARRVKRVGQLLQVARVQEVLTLWIVELLLQMTENLRGGGCYCAAPGQQAWWKNA